MRIYQSSDASAPTLQGVVGGAYSSGWADGSLLNLLDKCLVAGYGSKTGAGWTRSYTGTSKGVFRQGAGCQFYFRVLDDGSLTAGAREAQFYGGETASDVDTLLGQFPTSGQQATYMKFRKSNAASATQRSWLVAADSRTAIVFAWSNQGDGLTDYLAGMYIGDFSSYHDGDAYNCCAVGRVTSATLDSSANENLDRSVAGTGTATAGHYMARGYAQAGSSVAFSAGGDIFSNASFMGGDSSALAVPNPTDSKLILSRIYVLDAATVPTANLRGFLRGLWSPQHTTGQLPRELPIGGAVGGNLAGRTFRILGLPTGNSGLYTLEVSDTWDA